MSGVLRPMAAVAVMVLIEFLIWRTLFEEFHFAWLVVAAMFTVLAFPFGLYIQLMIRSLTVQIFWYILISWSAFVLTILLVNWIDIVFPIFDDDYYNNCSSVSHCLHDFLLYDVLGTLVIAIYASMLYLWLWLPLAIFGCLVMRLLYRTR